MFYRRKMTIAKASLIMLAATPLFAQEEVIHRGEVYAIGGYSRIHDTSGPCFFCFGRTAVQGTPVNGGFFGAGAGVRIGGIFGVQGEFFQSRTSRSLQQPYLNTGALNFVLEKRTGRIRPGGIVLGIGGGQGPKGGQIFVQFGAGVAVMLTERVYVRPQVRWQGWMQLFGSDPNALSGSVAVGYRF